MPITGSLASILSPTLPPIDVSMIANSLTAGSTPCLCQLLILDGQYVIWYEEGETMRSKLISPTAVRQAFTHLPVDSGFLPPSIVRWGSGVAGDWLVKFIAPNCYPISCHLVEGTHALEIPLPGLIFMGFGNRYYVWAVKSRCFDANAPVFHVPLPNVSHDGVICFGSNSVPPASSETLEQTWQLFLNSPFNGDSASGKSKSHPDDVRSHLVALHDARKKKYPLRDLVPYRSYRSGLDCGTRNTCTVEQIVNQIIS
jgi:hypothetical protein